MNEVDEAAIRLPFTRMLGDQTFQHGMLARRLIGKLELVERFLIELLAKRFLHFGEWFAARQLRLREAGAREKDKRNGKDRNAHRNTSVGYAQCINSNRNVASFIETSMKIGIIGSGNVGGALGQRWAKAGHTVVFGTRKPDSPEIQELIARSGGNARAGSQAEAAKVSDVVLLATPWESTEQIVRGLGDLSGKIVVDAVNPLLPKLAGLDIGTRTSAAEQLAGWAPGARVVKAFNTVGANIMADPAFGGEKPVLFYCGDDKEAKAVAHQLATELGFDATDAGPLTQARVLEPFAMLWISLAYVAGLGRDIGFKLLRR